ncbi:MAG: S9 family peptidase [Bacteroidales bacterium]|nr:S9 family peptidase [Bacteroidales bacterium]
MKNILRLLLPVAGLLIGNLLCAQVTTRVQDFRLAGPFAVSEGTRIADVQLAEGQTTIPWHGENLPVLADSPSAGILTFRTGTGSWMEGRLTVEGPKAHKLWIDGKESDGHLHLNPYPHEFKILYLADTGAETPLKVSFDTKAPVQTSVSDKRDITIYDILNGTRVNGVALSPTGRYTLLQFSENEGSQSKRYSVLRETASNREITRFDGPAPQWMPKSEALLVKEDGDLFRIDPATLKKTLLVKEMPEGWYTVSPTEDFLILQNTEPGPKEDPDVFEILEPEDRQPGWRDRSYLSKLDLKTGLSTRLTHGSRSTWLSDISADGTKLLLNASRSRLEKRPTTVTDVMIMDLQTMQVDTLLRDAEFLETMCFSPDSRQLLVRASPEAFDRIGEHILPGQVSSMIYQVLYRYETATGRVTPLTDKMTQSVGSFLWSKGDGQIYFSAEDSDRVSLYCLNPKNGKVTDLAPREEMVSGFSCAPGCIAYVGEGASNSMRCWVMDLKKKSHALLEDSSAEILKDIQLGEVHEWNYKNSRGETIYGRYYLPPHFDPAKKYPMIVNYYGGCSPTGRNFESRYPHPVYAAMGYVVYIVQPSGATGFGQSFAARHVNTWGEYGADDIIEGVKRFCMEHDFVNPEKIGCIGASFGGFMSQYLVTVTDLFATAISHAGISDITSYWGEGYWGYSYCEVSTAHNYPWNAADLFVRQSPLFHADKVHTPILFLHGTADHNVPVGESIQMFTALKLLGRETAFVAVKDQDHHILQYDKRLKWQETIFAWFARYLKDDPSWWDALYPKKDL